jgi:spore coat protein U-like protein
MKTMIRLTVIAALIAISAPAFAATVGSSFDVTANVSRTCQFLTAGPLTLTFGTPYDTMDPVDNADGSLGFSLRCNKNTQYTILIGNGSNYAAGTRRMVSGSYFLEYGLFKNALRNQPWGSTLPVLGVGGDVVIGTALSNAPIPQTVYGLITALQDVPFGTYTDTNVTITVNY